MGLQADQVFLTSHSKNPGAASYICELAELSSE
jgi:hypothetical protein